MNFKKVMKIINGNLIKLALEGYFDVIVHGVNCFCTQKSGLAPQMCEVFGTDEFMLEKTFFKDKYGKVHKTNNLGDINKLGTIQHKNFKVYSQDGYVTNENLSVVNLYSQFEPGYNSIYPDKPPVNYEALRLGFVKMNKIFAGKKIGLPEIGCGLAGGDIKIVKQIAKEEFTKCEVFFVEFDGVIYNKHKTDYVINECI